MRELVFAARAPRIRGDRPRHERGTRQAIGITPMRLVLALFPFVLCGCRADAGERRAAEQATRDAERIAEQTAETTLASATIEIDALRGEQRDYAARLVAALDELDRDARRRGTSVKGIVARRETLKGHLDAIDRTTAADWAALKAKIDRDLERGGR